MKDFISQHIFRNFELDLWTLELPYMFATIILGIINHFLYDLSGGSALIALFCPINESIWEHLKLLFFPFLFVTLLMSRQHRTRTLSFFYCHFLGVIFGMLFIVTAFFTYTGIFGTELFILDILIYLFSVWITFSLAAYYRHKKTVPPTQQVVFSLWIVTSLLFFAFTCFPPNIPLFFPIS
ncbi:MAG: DUF6512 family protein [Dorea sp.]